jgi:Protein of unknown function (DUF2934)
MSTQSTQCTPDGPSALFAPPQRLHIDALAEYHANCKSLIDQLFTPADRHQMVAKAAYLRAERRGFIPGHELEDWLWAEHQVHAACGLLEPRPQSRSTREH